MFFMDLQIFGENVGSREHLRQKLLQLNCIQEKTATTGTSSNLYA